MCQGKAGESSFAAQLPRGESKDRVVSFRLHTALQGLLLTVTCRLQLKSKETEHLRSAYEELAASFEQLRLESEAREALYVEQINSWRGEVDSKHAQYEEAYSQVLRPEELEKLRNHLVEEIEVPTRVVIYELQCELDDAVRVYDNAVADLDALRTLHDVEIARLLKEMESQKIEHAKEIDTMREEFNAHEENLKLKSEEVAALRADAANQLHILAQNRAVASDNELQRRLRTQALHAAERADQELRSRTVQTEQLERRVKMLQDKADENALLAHRLQAALEESEGQKDNLMRMLEKQHSQRTEKIKQAVSKATQKFTVVEAHISVEREEAARNYRTMATRFKAHDEALQKVQKSCVAEIQAAENSARAAESRRLQTEIKLDATLTDLAACKVDLLKATSEVDALRESFARLDMEYSCQIPSLRNALEQSRAVRINFPQFSIVFTFRNFPTGQDSRKDARDRLKQSGRDAKERDA